MRLGIGSVSITPGSWGNRSGRLGCVTTGTGGTVLLGMGIGLGEGTTRTRWLRSCRSVSLGYWRYGRGPVLRVGQVGLVGLAGLVGRLGLVRLSGLVMQVM
ncbi:hypothetical protein GCM10010522_48330 [Kribbella solani]